MKMSYSPAADFPVVEVQPRRSRTAEITGTVAGTVVRFTHDIRRDGAAATLRTWLQRYPALLVGAGIAGYLTGRMVRGR
jgi:hypothetical protein